MVNRRRQNRRRRAGLTLIEVMLALVILGTGLVALVTAASRCLAVIRQAKNYDTARELIGVVELENPILFEEDIEDAAGSGTFDSPYNQFRWKRDIEMVGLEEDGLWEIRTVISWSENQIARDEEVVTYLYWPEDKKGGSFESAP